MSKGILVVPKVLVFIFSRGKVLLIKMGPDKGWMSGKYNAIGGHVERNENIYEAARRELIEETGLDLPGIKLVGTAIDTTEDPGTIIFIFAFESEDIMSVQEREGGELIWINVEDLTDLNIVDDLPFLLQIAAKSLRANDVFHLVKLSSR